MILKSLILFASIWFICLPATAEEKRLILTKENSVVMGTVFDGTAVAKLTQQVRDLDSRLKSKEPIFLIMNSPGGEIDAGIELIENLRNMNRPIHTLSLFSASMGFQTVQGLGARLITKNGTLMAHKARGTVSGEFPGQLDSRYNYYLRRVKNLDKQAVFRTKGKHTMKSFAALIENEFYCDGQDCVDQGLADEVVRPTCDKSLSGTKTEDLEVSFMGMPVIVHVVFAACPLTTGVISYSLDEGGAPEEKATAKFLSSLNEENRAKLNAKILEILDTRNSKRIVQRY